MGKIKFEEGSANDLPIGSHEPCKLVSVTYHEPDERRWPSIRISSRVGASSSCSKTRTASRTARVACGS